MSLTIAAVIFFNYFKVRQKEQSVDVLVTLSASGAVTHAVTHRTSGNAELDQATRSRAYADGREAKDGIGAYITLYNGSRPHSSLEGETPDSAFFQQLPELRAA